MNLQIGLEYSGTKIGGVVASMAGGEKLAFFTVAKL